MSQAVSDVLRLSLTGRIPCLFRAITGLYCPGCGGTRAVLALLTGHPVKSFLYHPLVLYCAVLGAAFAVSMARSLWTKDKKCRLELTSRYVYGGLFLTAANFLIKNVLLIAAGIDVLRMLDQM